MSLEEVGREITQEERDATWEALFGDCDDCLWEPGGESCSFHANVREAKS